MINNSLLQAKSRMFEWFSSKYSNAIVLAANLKPGDRFIGNNTSKEHCVLMNIGVKISSSRVPENAIPCFQVDTMELRTLDHSVYVFKIPQ